MQRSRPGCRRAGGQPAPLSPGLADPGRRGRRASRRLRVPEARLDYGRRGPGRLPHQSSDRDSGEGRDTRSAGRSDRPRGHGAAARFARGIPGGYDRTAAPVLTIAAPSGSANDIAAADAASDFAHIARKNGVPASRIMLASYQAGPEEVSAPVRVSFLAMRAQTGKCGRWPEDILEIEREQALCQFRLFLPEQRRSPDRQSGRPSRAEKTDADRCRESRCGYRRLSGRHHRPRFD